MWLLTYMIGLAAAATLQVPGDAPTVRDAVLASAPGDVIIVDGDAYAGEASVMRIDVPHALTIEGVGATAPEVPGFTVDNVAADPELRLTLRGLVVRTGADPNVDGCDHGVRVINGAASLFDVVFLAQPERARSSNAIFVTDGEVLGERLTMNEQFCVAPVHAVGATLDLADITVAPMVGMRDDAGAFALFDGTIATISRASVSNTDAAYGPLFAVDAIVTLIDADFHDNTADVSGAFTISGGEALISGGVFAGNRAPVGGGLFYGRVLDRASFGYLDTRLVPYVPARIVGALFEDNQGEVAGHLALTEDAEVQLVDALLLRGSSELASGVFVGSEPFGDIFAVTTNRVEVTSTLISDGVGSAFFAVGGSISLHDSQVIDNDAPAGGAFNVLATTVDVTESDLLGNRADVGGAFEIGVLGRVTVTDSVLDDAGRLPQRASAGGLVRIGVRELPEGGPTPPPDDFTIDDVRAIFTAERTSLINGFADEGSAIASTGLSTITLDTCVISGNESLDGTFKVTFFDRLSVRRSELIGNVADERALISGAVGPESVTLSCNRVCDNVSKGSTLVEVQQIPAGDSFPSPGLSFRNNLWFRNTALGVDPQSGLRNGTSVVHLNAGQGSSTFVNNTFVDEDVVTVVRAATIAIQRGRMQNNLFAGVPAAFEIGFDPVNVDYNLFFDVQTPWNEPLYDGANDIYAEPLLAGAPASDCAPTLWLQAGSPGFRQGDPTLLNLDGTRSSIGYTGGPNACLDDEDGDGVYEDLDCDDTDANNFPGNVEVCDGVDNDCDGLVDDDDDDLDGPIWYFDADGDGFGDLAVTLIACVPPSDDWVSNPDDCDDDDASVNPDAVEVCDGIDNDCDGLIDDEDSGLDLSAAPGWFADADGDGFGAGEPVFACSPPPGDWVGNGDDCDDANAAINPDAVEVCDGVDNDCDGLIDDADPDRDASTGSAWFVDADEDGFGAGDATLSCAPPAQGGPWVGNDDDCDDADASINPDAVEVCDGVDNDCDGLVDGADPDVDTTTARAWYLDADGDGFGAGSPVLACDPPAGGPWVTNADDCDDADASINPDAVEICDGVDNDCDGLIDDADPSVDASGGSAWYADVDGDGFGAGQATMFCEPPTSGGPWVTNADDCDDSDAAVNPDATEVCDGVDNDCNGFIDDRDFGVDPASYTTWYRDSDGDGAGDDATAVDACAPPEASGWVDIGGDCDDADATVTDTCDVWVAGGCACAAPGGGSGRGGWLVLLSGAFLLRRRQA